MGQHLGSGAAARQNTARPAKGIAVPDDKPEGGLASAWAIIIRLRTNHFDSHAA